MCTFFIFTGTFILFWMDARNYVSQKLRISCEKSVLSFRIFQTPLRDESFLSVHLFPAFFDIFKVFSIFLFYNFHVTIPFFSISPGICSFPAFFKAFSLFSILYQHFSFDLISLNIFKTLFARHMFLPLLFLMLSKYFQYFFLDNFIFLFLDIVKIFLWHMFLPCSFQCLPVRYLH